MARAAKMLAAVTCVACAGGGASSHTAPAPEPLSAAPAIVSYAPDASRFRFVAQVHSVQEVMGQSQELDVTTTYVLSAAVAAESGNLAATFRIDSVSSSGAMVGASTALDVLRGRTYRAVYSPLGRFVSLALPDSTNTAVVQAGELFRDFLSALPARPVEPGLAWADTLVQTVSPVPGMRWTSRVLREHRFVDWETRDGQRAAHIATSSRFTLTGDGSIQGQRVQVSGSGGGTSDGWVSATGRFLGGVSLDSASINVAVIDVGIDVPVQQTRRNTVTRLP